MSPQEIAQMYLNATGQSWDQLLVTRAGTAAYEELKNMVDKNLLEVRAKEEAPNTYEKWTISILNVSTIGSVVGIAYGS